ncbi:hypothetical protein IV203_007427 [Nitzschia inconspicua]|uniref:Uncharacterized protein n=1 Tax=Nitzschia inconspicua TaxID=303405 RepID=A0A9K3KEM5_9STRA|nr:hypothetical protein IV203_007427 [Nitzschia inconspicua]
MAYNISASRNRNSVTKVDSSRYYSEYYGHKVRHLEVLLPQLRADTDSLIWTAGDSSLDNKYWFSDIRSAVGLAGYEQVLDPPRCNADVTYWLNYLANARGSRLGAINTAVEATTLNERTFRLRPQDRFLRDNIQSNDILIVSVGGNDVAMAPTPCTIFSILSMVKLPSWCLKRGCVVGSMPCDEYCCGCGPAAMGSCLCAFPPCFGYLVHLFGTRVKRYIEKLVAKTKPKTILVCMYYYLDENPTPSWAGLALGCLDYNSSPHKLQTLIRRAFVEATSKIEVPGCEVIPIPLFNVLDGKNSRDYVARVEPSSEGGFKMAEYLLDTIQRVDAVGDGGERIGDVLPTTSITMGRQ